MGDFSRSGEYSAAGQWYTAPVALPTSDLVVHGLRYAAAVRLRLPCGDADDQSSSLSRSDHQE